MQTSPAPGPAKLESDSDSGFPTHDGASAGDSGEDSVEDLTRTQELPGPMPGRRRRFTSEEKRQFIKQAMAPGESMSSVGRRHGLSVSLLFRWRRQLDGTRRPSDGNGEDAARSEARELRDRVRELERLLGRKTLEADLLQQELTRLGHNPSAALLALESATGPADAAR